MCSIDTDKLAATIEGINRSILEVRAVKSTHPELKLGFYEGNVGSLLNAYREGDLSFDECVERLIPRHAVAEALAALRKDVVELIPKGNRLSAIDDAMRLTASYILDKTDTAIAKLGLDAAQEEGK